jgi:BirA family biotin operon repressor/biotin-[acetyl-CoA-carboxylase] ligase
MEFETIHIAETDSTNRWLRDHAAQQGTSPNGLVVMTDYQTAGRGCGTNHWESEQGQNLLFSLLVCPQALVARDQFAISMAVALAICDALASYIKEVSIKWPNDIYWRDRKLCGMLIENRLSGGLVRESIIGIGLNVNQTLFLSDAPNPVSLRQILGREVDREALLQAILAAFDRRFAACDVMSEERLEAFSDLRTDYASRLYRREGFHPYRDAAGEFEAQLETVEEGGRLVLRDRMGRLRRYDFKGVEFIIIK